MVYEGLIKHQRGDIGELTLKYSSLFVVAALLKYGYSFSLFSQLFLAMPNSSRNIGFPMSALHRLDSRMKLTAKSFAALRFRGRGLYY